MKSKKEGGCVTVWPAQSTKPTLGEGKRERTGSEELKLWRNLEEGKERENSVLEERENVFRRIA